MDVLDKKESCERLARAICMDIQSYQKEYIQQYRQGLPMPAALVEAIEEGRALYLSRADSMYEDLFDETLMSFLGVDSDTAMNTPSGPSGWAPSSEWGRKSAASASPVRTSKRARPERSARPARSALPAAPRFHRVDDGQYTKPATTEYDRRQVSVDSFSVPKGVLLLIAAIIAVFVVFFLLLGK